MVYQKKGSIFVTERKRYNKQLKKIKIMNTIEQVNNSVEFFLLAAKECGFETPEKIEENFEMVAFIALEMVKDSKDRVLTKLASNPNCIQYLAARYQSKVLAND